MKASNFLNLKGNADLLAALLLLVFGWSCLRGTGIMHSLQPDQSTANVSLCDGNGDEIRASRVKDVRKNGFPSADEWERAEPVSFCRNWQGREPDPQRSTEVRVMWAPDKLYLRFRCQYRELYVFDTATASGRKEQLWDRDVAEAFLQPDRFGEHFYKEFEVAPNGFWIDLDIFPSAKADLHSGMKAVVTTDEKTRLWTAEVAIPMRSLTRQFDPHQTWRANFFRAEGREPKRAYFSWRPTNTPQPNFHVHEAFGVLRFVE
jgi:alpha-galactosidase